ncbi:MAG: MarR family winged helix-turn-helix transcriptional regulator [Actinomycetota bacterium]|nr:MarR family winged helix-turn-helix transcriptional regulator [Actinomycetota bacterium]
MTEPASGASGARWLTEPELAAWKGFQRMHAHLTGALAHDLAAHSELSMQDYQVIAVLCDQPDARMRAGELGRELGWEKSRLSHHVARMADRGLVERVRCPSDRRGLFVSLTSHGRQVQAAAAPSHVAAVRRSFIDLLDPDQLAAMAGIARVVVDALDGPRSAPSVP